MNTLVKYLLIAHFFILSLITFPLFAETCGIVVTKETPLTVRSRPNSKASRIGKASKGSALRLFDYSNSWYKVKLNNGKSGYSHADYIKEVTTNICGIVTTKSDSLNIRSRPRQTAKIVSQADKGSALRILNQEANNWSHVKTNDGIYGYVSNDYIKQLN